MFKRHYIDEIEYPPSPMCGEKPKFESNITSFQFRQNASARWSSPQHFGRENELSPVLYFGDLLLSPKDWKDLIFQNDDQRLE